MCTKTKCMIIELVLSSSKLIWEYAKSTQQLCKRCVLTCLLCLHVCVNIFTINNVCHILSSLERGKIVSDFSIAYSSPKLKKLNVKTSFMIWMNNRLAVRLCRIKQRVKKNKRKCRGKKERKWWKKTAQKDKSNIIWVPNALRIFGINSLKNGFV